MPGFMAPGRKIERKRDMGEDFGLPLKDNQSGEKHTKLKIKKRWCF